MPLSKEVETKKKILKELSETDRGLTIKDLADKCSVSRYTVAKVIQRLVGEERVEVRAVGPAKLHYIIK